MIRIGVGSWTLPWAVGFRKNPYSYPKMTVFELIQFAHENDTRVVQLYNNMDLFRFNDLELREIKDFSTNLGIELSIGGEGIDQDYLLRLLRIAEKLDSATIRTIIPPVGADPKMVSKIDAVVDEIGKSKKNFNKCGRFLLIENHDRYTSRQYHQMVNELGSDWSGICFDTANGVGNLEHFRDGFRILQEYIHCLHFKDYEIKRSPTNLGFVVDGCKPGFGDVNIQEFHNLVQLLKIDLDIIIEQWIPFQTSVEDTLQIEKQWAVEGIYLLKKYF